MATVTRSKSKLNKNLLFEGGIFPYREYRRKSTPDMYGVMRSPPPVKEAAGVVDSATAFDPKQRVPPTPAFVQEQKRHRDNSVTDPAPPLPAKTQSQLDLNLALSQFDPGPSDGFKIPSAPPAYQEASKETGARPKERP